MTVQLRVCLLAGLLAGLLPAACGRDTRVFLGQDRPNAAPPVAGQSAPAEPDASTREPTVILPDVDAAATQSAGASSPPPPVCAAGYADCDGDLANGCEADLLSSAQHCGACNVDCTQPGCVCEDGAPVLRCEDGTMDCDGMIENGCETAVDADPANCGTCGHACSDRGPGVASVACTAGACVVTCNSVRIAPLADCDGDPDNGCEAPLWEDRSNCGKCGTTCTFCDDGKCL